jgi:hypothetical protein
MLHHKLERLWLKNIELNLKSNWLKLLNNKSQLSKNSKKNKKMIEKLKPKRRLGNKLFFWPKNKSKKN